MWWTVGRFPGISMHDIGVGCDRSTISLFRSSTSFLVLLNHSLVQPFPRFCPIVSLSFCSTRLLINHCQRIALIFSTISFVLFYRSLGIAQLFLLFFPSANPSVVLYAGSSFQARRKEKQATADMKRRYQQGGGQFTQHANVAMHTTLVRTPRLGI